MSAYRRSMHFLLKTLIIYTSMFIQSRNNLFDVSFVTAHIRTGSTGSLSNSPLSSQSNDMCPIASSSQEEMRCYLEQQHQGHQQLVTCMDVVGNTVLTGSQDHTLKVSSFTCITLTND